MDILPFKSHVKWKKLYYLVFFMKENFHIYDFVRMLKNFIYFKTKKKLFMRISKLKFNKLNM